MAVNPEMPKAAAAITADRGIGARCVSATGGAGATGSRRPQTMARPPTARLTTATTAQVVCRPSTGIRTKPAATQPNTAPRVLAA